MEQPTSMHAFTDPFLPMEQDWCIPPSASKRSRKEESPGYVHPLPAYCGFASQASKRMRENRRASLTYFMDCSTSPIMLDITIDKRIFDSTPLTSNVEADAKMATLSSCPSHVPPPPFSEEHDSPKLQRFLHLDSVSNHPVIAVTMKIQGEIEQDCSPPSTVRKVEGENCFEARFHTHQTDIWTEKYEDLVQYKTKNGHCLVPNSFPPNPSLAEWVKRQRYQYKLRMAGQHSSMSDDRVAALEEVGFCWNSHDANWEDKFSDLVTYKRKFGDSNVPSTSKEFPQLAVWVKRQRRQHKFLMEGKASTISNYRKTKLESIGFSWSGRQTKKNSKT